MKKLNETLYLIEPGMYAEQRGEQWLITDEQEKVQAGPFVSLQVLEDSLKPGAEELRSFGGDVVRVVVTPPGLGADPNDLVTLTEAATHLPITRQALYAAAKRGTLSVEPLVVGRQTKLYSLRALKEAYPS